MLFTFKRSVLIGITVSLLLYGNLMADSDTPAKAAEVNGKLITYSDFQRQLEMTQQQMLRGRKGTIPQNVLQQLRTRVINRMIAEELLYQESQKAGIKVAPEVIDKELAVIKGRFEDTAKYDAALKQMNVTEDGLKAQIARKVAVKEIIGKEIVSKINITEEEAKALFEKNPEKFRRPERVRARHILIKVNKDDSEEKKTEARKKLEAVKQKLLGGEDFAELAKEHSEGPSNVRGGDLGYFARGQMVKPFENAAFSLAPNEISEIVETQFGYHLIKVVDHQDQKDPTFDEIKSRLLRQMQNEKIQNELEPYVAKLRDAARVENFVQ